jgi:hypothetical protein
VLDRSPGEPAGERSEGGERGHDQQQPNRGHAVPPFIDVG